MGDTKLNANSQWTWPAATFTELRLPSYYGWIILAGTLDILLTTVVLSLGGSEANPIASAIIYTCGLSGMVAYKYFIVGLVILGCEIVARTRMSAARRLAQILIVIHFTPVIWSSGLLLIIAT